MADQRTSPSSLAVIVNRERTDELDGLSAAAVEPLRAKPPSISASFLGLRVVYNPEHPTTDIVFVHGFGGHGYRTWAKNGDPDLFWPGSWLPLEPELSESRILTFGYNSLWKSSKKNISTVADFAKELLCEMRFGSDDSGHPLNLGLRPVLFVAHSMGGLVVKTAYLLGQHDQTFQDVIQSVSAFVFLSTPHRGARLAEVLNRVISVTFQAPKSFVSDINKGSPALEELNERFRHTAPKLPIWSFYETLATSIGPKKLIIVDKESSILGYPSEISRPLQADHKGMCKYDGPSDANYRSVRQALSSLVSTLSERGHGSFNPPNHAMMEDFFRQCSVSDDEYDTLRQQWMPHTCGWFLQDHRISSCLDGKPNRSGIFWYDAAPGSGKSVLAAFLAHHIRSSNKLCQYVIFKQPDSTQTSVVGALRALAAQASRDLPMFRRRLYGSTLESLSLKSNNALMIWRHTFLNHLLNLTMSTPIYWIIDALDECDNPKVLLQCLQDLGASKAPITVFLFSRKTEPIAMALERTARQVPVVRVNDLGRSQNHGDIGLYVEAELRDMPGSREIRNQVQKKILARSEGNFLWTSLVVCEILGCHTEEGVNACLEDIPDGMTKLYQRMERNLIESTKKAHMPLIKAILEWAVCATRVLSLDEFADALQPEYTGFLDLKRTITNACGQFIRVNEAEKVVLLHETAREYLKSGDAGELRINLCDSHAKLFIRTQSVFQNAGIGNNLPWTEHSLKTCDKFVCYAAVSWPYHIGRCGNDSAILWDNVLGFFRSEAVLLWIHALALLGCPEVLTRASRILAGFVRAVRQRNAESGLALYGPGSVKLLDLWVVDLVKLVGKFGRQLLADPGIVYGIVPALCPSETAIHKQFYSLNRSAITVHDGVRSLWNDHLGRVSMGKDASAWNLCCASNMIAALASSSIVHLWDATNFMDIGRITHGEAVLSMAMTDNGSKLITYGLTTTKLWSLPEGSMLASAASVTNTNATNMAFSPSYDRILAGFDDNTIRHISCVNFQSGWSILNAALLKATPPSLGIVNSPVDVKFSPDGVFVGSAYRGAPLTVWELASGRCLNKTIRRTSNEEHDKATSVPSATWYAVNEFVWNPATGHIIGMSRDNSIFKWHPVTGELTHSRRVAHNLSCSPTGTYFATSCPGSISIWDHESFSIIHQMKLEDFVDGLVFSPDGRRLYDVRGAAVNAWEPDCLAISLEGDKQTRQESRLTTQARHVESSKSRPITAFQMSPDGQSYCAGYEDGGLSIFRGDEDTGTELTQFHNCLNIGQVSWSSDGKFVACADLAGEVRVLSTGMKSTGAIPPSPMPAPAIESGGGAIRDFIFSVDSQRLLVRSTTSAWIFSVETGQLQRVMDLASLEALAVHRKLPRSLLAVGSAGIRVFDWETGQLSVALHFEPARTSQVSSGDGPSLSGSRAGAEYGAMEERDEPEGIDMPRISTDVDVLQSSSYMMAVSKPTPTHASLAVALLHMDELISSVQAEPARSAEGSVKVTWLPHNILKIMGTALGIFRDSDLAFLDPNLWLHTCPLARGPEDRTSPPRRHYFLPRDWISSISLESCVISEQGRLFWPREDRIVWIDCDLDPTTEFGCRSRHFC